MMGTLNIQPNQWRIASEFFKNNEGSNKLPKKENPDLGCSFIKVDGVIYAMANGEYLGEGGFSKVKVVETEKGLNHVVKIEGKGIDLRTTKEVAAMQKLGKFISIMERTLPKEIDFWKGKKTTKHMTQQKTYKIVQKEEGIELHTLIYKNPHSPFTAAQKLIIAIRICQVLEHIHGKGVIHADIKPDNMLATVNGNNIRVAILDFGFSIVIENGQTMVIDEAKGTDGYIAPEIYNKASPELSKRQFSFASDIYALGALFKNNLKLDNALSEKLLSQEPQNRPFLREVKAALVAALAKLPGLDETAKEVIGSFKHQGRPLPTPPKTIPRPQPVPVAKLEATHEIPGNTESTIRVSTAKNYKSQLSILLSKKPSVINQPIQVPTFAPYTTLRVQNKKAPILQLNNELKERFAKKENRTIAVL
jgi:serine/threonine protein kinase